VRDRSCRRRDGGDADVRARSRRRRGGDEQQRGQPDVPEDESRKAPRESGREAPEADERESERVHRPVEYQA
jgi:hypothetical protein